jgi:hypothetical protein
MASGRDLRDRWIGNRRESIFCLMVAYLNRDTLICREARGAHILSCPLID